MCEDHNTCLIVCTNDVRLILGHASSACSAWCHPHHRTFPSSTCQPTNTTLNSEHTRTHINPLNEYKYTEPKHMHLCTRRRAYASEKCFPYVYANPMLVCVCILLLFGKQLQGISTIERDVCALPIESVLLTFWKTHTHIHLARMLSNEKHIVSEMKCICVQLRYSIKTIGSFVCMFVCSWIRHSAE